MAIFEWNEDTFSVKVPSIDAQHRQLFTMVNELHSALEAQASETSLMLLLNELSRYAYEHFDYEEAMQEKAGYQKLNEHIIEHNNLRNSVVNFHERFTRGEVKLDLEIFNFLVNWLLNHVLVADKDFSAVMQAKGIE